MEPQWTGFVDALTRTSADHLLHSLPHEIRSRLCFVVCGFVIIMAYSCDIFTYFHRGYPTAINLDNGFGDVRHILILISSAIASILILLNIKVHAWSIIMLERWSSVYIMQHVVQGEMTYTRGICTSFPLYSFTERKYYEYNVITRKGTTRCLLIYRHLL